MQHASVPYNPRMPRQQMRRLFFRMGAVFVGLLGTLLAAELTFHILGIEAPTAPQTDQIDAFKVRNDLNELGLRESPSFPPPRREGEIRIAVLGDSMTYGEGVEAVEAFPALLAGRIKSIAANDLEGRFPTVVNMGKLGDDTPDEVLRFRRLADSVDPDVVLLVVYVNDFVGAGGADDALHRIYRLRDELSWPSQYSRVCEYVERKIRLRVSFNETIRHYRADAERGVEPEALKPVADSVAELAGLCRARNCRLVICMMPWLVRLHDYPLPAMHAAVQKMSNDLGLPYCDLLPAVANQDDEAMRVSPANHHPSRAAHARIAGYLADWLVRQRVLESTRD